MKKIIFLGIILFACSNLIAQAYDSSFNQTGTIFTAHDQQISSDIWDSSDGRNILMQPDGKIILHINGGPYSYSQRSILWRYNGDGSVDSSFGTNGKVTFPYASPNAPQNGWFPFCQLLSDGKILMMRYVPTSATVAGFIEIDRLNTDGSFDNTFGVNGQKTILNPLDTATTFNTNMNATIAADGYIYFTLTQYLYSTQYFYRRCLVRLKPDYTLDTGFGTGGFMIPRLFRITNL
jgi:uncharacterized delta-60 repeat protein